MAAPKIEIHPAANLFPMLSDDEITELGKSIEKHGLREKIVALAEAHDDRTDYLVVDGRNRLEALRRVLKLSDTDIIKDYISVMRESGTTTAEEYVVMANIERRNLTQVQRRELAGKLAVMIQERQKDKEKSEKVDAAAAAAAAAGVSRRTAADAAVKEKSKTAKPKQKAADKPKPEPKPPAASIIIGRLDTLQEMLLKPIPSKPRSMSTVKYLQTWKVAELNQAHKLASNIAEMIDVVRKGEKE